MGGKISKEQRDLLIVAGASILVGTGLYFALKPTTTKPDSKLNSVQASTQLPSTQTVKSPQMSDKVPSPQQQQQQQLLQKTTDSNITNSTSANQNFARRVYVEYNPNSQILTIQTIMQILEVSLDLMSDEYVELTKQNRIKRRQARKNDYDSYEKLILDYNEGVEQLIEKAQEKLCGQIGISVDTFQESIMTLMERGFFQQFFMIQASMRQKIKEKMQATKSMDLAQTKEIIKFQLQLLESQPQDIMQVIAKLSQDQELAQLIPLTINTIIADYIYEKYEVEEEDQIKTISNPKILQDQEMQVLLQRMEQAMMQLMGPMNLGEDDMMY